MIFSRRRQRVCCLDLFRRATTLSRDRYCRAGGYDERVRLLAIVALAGAVAASRLLLIASDVSQSAGAAVDEQESMRVQKWQLHTYQPVLLRGPFARRFIPLVSPNLQSFHCNCHGHSR